MPSRTPFSSAAAARSGASTAQPDWRATLGRSGLVAKGILYSALGLLAIDVASGQAGSETATKRGAIELVASQPFGQWLLGLLTCGLFALAAWHVILAVKGDPVEATETKDRVKNAVKAVIYFGTAGTALGILLSDLGQGGAANAGGGSQQATATVLGMPGGPWMVAAAGAGIIGFGMVQLYKHGWHKEFMRRLAAGQMSPEVRRAVEHAGQWGYAARAVVIAVVGAFFVVAALQHDPQETVGLSGALAVIAAQTWGRAVLWGVAVGVLLYGCFCFAEAKYRRAT